MRRRAWEWGSVVEPFSGRARCLERQTSAEVEDNFLKPDELADRRRRSNPPVLKEKRKERR